MIGYAFSDFGYLEVQGEDRLSFLQNLLTQDVKVLDQQPYTWAALLTPKSKLIAWMKMVVMDQSIQLWMPNQQLTQTFDTLERYIITEDVTLQTHTQAWHAYLWQEPTQLPASTLALPSQDFTDPTWCLLGHEPLPFLKQMASTVFDAKRAQSGYPLWQVDFEDPLPLEIPFMHRGFSFSKGCYVGQETIARLHGRGMNVGKSLVGFRSSKEFKAGQALSTKVDPSLAWVTSGGMLEEGFYGLAWIKRKALDHGWADEDIDLLN
jgi:folate-binding protein YgfZ